MAEIINGLSSQEQLDYQNLNAKKEQLLKIISNNKTVLANTFNQSDEHLLIALKSNLEYFAQEMQEIQGKLDLYNSRLQKFSNEDYYNMLMSDHPFDNEIIKK